MTPSTTRTHTDNHRTLLRSHPRTFQKTRFVYPVLSRRSQGISVGINLNPDKICNFDCIYCQVDRTRQSETRFVEMSQMLTELEYVLDLISSGSLYLDPRFSKVPTDQRRLNDLAFSGDGEPTTYRNFDRIVEKVAQVKRRRGLTDTKLVLITNASMFHRKGIQRALSTLNKNNGEIWAKLEAGTADYFQLIDRTTIPFARILENITYAGQLYPIVIQSLFMRVENAPPTQTELVAYYKRLEEMVLAGVTIKLVQIYTVARPPAESYVSALADEELQQIAMAVRQRLSIPVEWYPN